MLQTSMSLIYRAAVITVLYAVSASVFYMLLTTDYVPDNGVDGLRLTIFVLLAPIIIKYVIQLLSAPFYSLVEHYRRSKLHAGLSLEDQNDNPWVSVLIPAWNEEVGIIKTIQSVLNTGYKKLEVIIINDGSTDRTHDLVSRFVESHNSTKTSGNTEVNSSAELRYLQLTNGGKARALNRGLSYAKGDYIVTIDADSIMDCNAINQLLLGFSDSRVAAVAGNVVVGNRKKPIELMQQLEYLYGFFFKRADSNFNAVYIIGGAAAAYRKNVLQELGGFDESIITEDIEMSTRILACGYQTRYAAKAVIFTEGPSDWAGLCRQRLRWKYGRLLTFIKHKNLFFSCKKKHNPYLTCLLLPMAVYAEITLLFEALLLSVFYGYTIYTNDYLPLAFVIGFITLLVTLQVLFDSKAKFHLNLIILAPIAWIIFYIIDAVELQALYRSLKRLIKREDLEWQRWVRVGLLNKALTPHEKALESE